MSATATESNGPDRFNWTPGCSQHQSGVRTGIKDYGCCCDPCQYVRDPDDPARMSERLCCRCSPKFILAKFTPDNANHCCRRAATAMAISVWTDAVNQNVMRYTGDIVGHTAYIYLSNEHVEDGGVHPNYVQGCRWTIRIDSLGIYEEIAIDHETVTCLGVPSISITGVTALNTCVGTISLANYETVKVPFQKRVSEEYHEDGYGMMLPLPYGFECENCTEIPRFICVSTAQPYTARHQQLTAKEKLQERAVLFWKDFEWDTSFEPFDHEYSEDIVIGRWQYQPEDHTAFRESLYLIKTRYDGLCWLQPDFLAPAGTDGHGEYYKRVQLTSCGCNLRILNVRAVNDASPNPSYRDGNGIDYRIGRCGCWSYVCGNRRCVNRYFCGFVFVDRQLYRNILFTWHGADKCWHSSGGVDVHGYAMPFSMSICLESDGKGGCQLRATYGGYGGYSLIPMPINDEDTVMSKTFNGTNAAGTDYITLFVTTSFNGECGDFADSCTQATPCAGVCGSHPAILFANLHGFTEHYDIPALSPPLNDECLNEVTMIFYKKIVAIVDGNISYLCGYIGFSVVPSNWFNPATGMSQTEDQLLVFELSMGALTITRRRLIAPTVIINTDVVPVHQTCDPYHGYFSSYDDHGPRLTACFFGDNRIFFYRYTVEITE